MVEDKKEHRGGAGSKRSWNEVWGRGRGKEGEEGKGKGRRRRKPCNVKHGICSILWFSS